MPAEYCAYADVEEDAEPAAAAEMEEPVAPAGSEEAVYCWPSPLRPPMLLPLPIFALEFDMDWPPTEGPLDGTEAEEPAWLGLTRRDRMLRSDIWSRCVTGGIRASVAGRRDTSCFISLSSSSS